MTETVRRKDWVNILFLTLTPVVGVVGTALYTWRVGFHPWMLVLFVTMYLLVGLSICAERTALAVAITQGSRRLRRIWIYTPTGKTTPPCGACRQMLAEFAPGIDVVLLCDGAPARRISLDRLLPGSGRRAGPSS